VAGGERDRRTERSADDGASQQWRNNLFIAVFGPRIE